MKPAIFYAAVLSALLVGSALCQADVFDRHTNPILQKALEGPDVQEVKSLTSESAFQHDRALPGVVGTFIIVRTNEGRNAKLLVQWARQKTGQDKSIPMILIDRYTCYREGEERTINSTGQNLSFFPGFRLSLDIGQLVPAELAADLACKLVDKGAVLEPVGKAKLFLVRTSLLPKPTPGAALPKPGEGPFDPKYFAGTYKLNDDGRRGGTLELQVKERGEITGAYFSDGTGQKYEVSGKVGSPKNSVQFTIRFPRAEQVFHGWLFTGDARGLTGYSTMQERETGFYAVRVEAP
jgi:hypothetical protein